MKNQNKTLQEATNELKASINRLHNARRNFLKAYEDSLRLDRYEGDSYFQAHFGEKMTIHDWTQN